MGNMWFLCLTMSCVWFLFCCRFTLALCMFIFIFTSAEHWWLRAARGARASSRVAPRLLGRRLGPAGGCQGRPWPLPEGCQGRQRILVAASGVLVGRFWAAGGWQGRLWAAAWRPPGRAEHSSGCSWGLLLEPA